MLEAVSMRSSYDDSEAIRVYILDDHEVVRRGLRDLLEDKGMVVVGESGSAAEASRRIPALTPHVAVLDARLADGTGIEVCRNVRAVDPRITCLILTAHDDRLALRAAVLAGAAGYVLKQIASQDLAASIRRVAAGEVLFDVEDEQEALDGVAEETGRPTFEGLSRQEARVLELIGLGLTNREIGQEMSLAETTVKNYVSSVLAKLGFARRTQAALYVAREGQGNPGRARNAGT